MNSKRKVFIEEYLKDFNATQAAIRAGYSERTAYSSGQRLLKNVEVESAIRERLNQLKAGADEVLMSLTSQMRADLGDYFKVSDVWLRKPLPTHEIIDEAVEEILDAEGEVVERHTKYLCRAVVLDVERLKDPRYSMQLKKFTDSHRTGMSIEITDKQSAAKLLGQAHRLFVDRHEVDARLSIENVDRLLDKVYGSNSNDHDPES
ncbi:MAG: terminase small subunit [bacterium]